jgi:hypothetical protein
MATKFCVPRDLPHEFVWKLESPWYYWWDARVPIRHLESVARMSGTSLIVQIQCQDNMECAPSSATVLAGLHSWLDSWLDKDSPHGQVTIQFRETDGEGLELRPGDGQTIFQAIL